jgi:tRNA pseudouridine38-40 synthase
MNARPDSASKNVKLIVAYDGTRYLGWQKTFTGPSIEGCLQEVLEKILQHPTFLQAASRTDAGVHADKQVVNFFTPHSLDYPRLKHSLNSLLPDDIVILEASEAPTGFHPTLEAKAKEYHYAICHGNVQLPKNRLYEWHYPCALDIEAMRQSAMTLTGEHDFAAFCNVKKNAHYKNTIRTVSNIEIQETFQKTLKIIIRGENFLYKMVRNIVGTLMYIGCGKLSQESLTGILSGLDRKQAGMTAPAHKVTYKYN